MAHLKYVCIRFHDPPTEEELRREHLNRELSADNSIYQTGNRLQMRILQLAAKLQSN